MQKLLAISLAALIVVSAIIATTFKQDILTFTYERLLKSCYELHDSPISICYPVESTFYPYAMITLIISGTVIVLIILILRWLQQRLPGRIQDYFPKKIDTVALVGVIVSALVVFAPLVAQNAILDYDITGTKSSLDDNVTQLRIALGNFGIIAAKNVVISMDSNDDSVKFSSFTSEPILPGTIEPNNELANQNGNAMLKIGVLPPRSVTLLEVDVSAINEANVTTHVRSDDVVGYHNSLLTSIVYGVVLIPIVAIVIYKALPQKRQEQISKRIIQARDYMESNLPPRKKDGPNKVSDNAGWPILKK